jgi:peroxiredoxin
MSRLSFGVAITICAFALSSARADRQEDFAKLEMEFEAAGEKFQADHRKENPTDADRIRNFEDYHLWSFVPRFLALAEANPEDATAFRCCQWIVAKNPGAAGDRAKFEAEQKAWAILAAHHANGDRFPELCLEAAQSASPAREQFLRGLLKRPNLASEHIGYAKLALAVLLIKKMDEAELFQKEFKSPPQGSLINHIKNRLVPKFLSYVSDTNADVCKAESVQLLHAVIERYGDVPNTISKPYFRNMATLGDKAKKSLHALEHLFVGAEAPDIVGQDLDGRPLNLKDYRGRVVLLSFWFTGCGPCMAMIPEEQKLIDKFKDRPFALLGVTEDAEITMSRRTAIEHHITWPCWFDGASGSIHRDYDITHWPTFYLLDQDGRIVQMDPNRDHLEELVNELMDKSKQGYRVNLPTSEK